MSQKNLIKAADLFGWAVVSLRNNRDWRTEDNERNEPPAKIPYRTTELDDGRIIYTDIEEVEEARDLLSYNQPEQIPEKIWRPLERKLAAIHGEKVEKERDTKNG